MFSGGRDVRERKAARSAWVAVVLLVTPLGLATLPARAGSQAQKKPTYAELVEKAKNGDPGLDFGSHSWLKTSWTSGLILPLRLLITRLAAKRNLKKRRLWRRDL